MATLISRLSDLITQIGGDIKAAPYSSLLAGDRAINGVKVETFPISSLQSSSTSMTSGAVYHHAFLAPFTETVTQMGTFVSTNLGGGDTGTGKNGHGIYEWDTVNSRFNRLGWVDMRTIWAAGGAGEKVGTLDTPVNLIRGRVYYFMIIGTGTTMVNFRAAGPAYLTNINKTAEPYRSGSKASAALDATLSTFNALNVNQLIPYIYAK
ncbi:hypothetical protein [Larkinella soli]|uniref:hypothetical protein n=1 Tax=Larkinella soli TaxID=1770527 RepID=UPI000FFBE2BD|nr:hypothetical protein [Larkinella soli]